MKNNKQQQQQQQQQQQPPIFQVRKLLRGDEEFVGNSHWASNCEDCQEDVKIERDPITQFPLSYQCDKNPQWVTSSTMVQFDYEVAITANKSQHDNVLAMQWRFLEQVAERTGLSERCNFEYQFEDANGIRPRNNGHPPGRRRLRRRRRMLNKNLYYPTTIYAIRSLPEDRPGTIGDCISLSYDPKTSDCFPVTAIMTVKYRGEPQDASFVQEYVKSVIQEEIQSDPSKLFVQDVTGLEYLGERTQFAKTTEDDDNASRIQAKQGWGIATMTTIVTLCTLICLGVAILMMRKRNSHEKETISPKTVQIENFPFGLHECSTDSLPDPPPDQDEYDVPVTLMASTEEIELSPAIDHHHDGHPTIDTHDPLSPGGAIQDLPSPPIQLQMPPIGRPLKVQRKRKQKKDSSMSQSSTSFSTLLPISETNSENETESDVDVLNDDEDDQSTSSDINFSFGDVVIDKDNELIMDDIFLNNDLEDL